jgi:hypothetical protein
LAASYPEPVVGHRSAVEFAAQVAVLDFEEEEWALK